MRILLTGKNGQLGWELHRQLERDHEIIAIGRDDLDFRDSSFLVQMLKQLPQLDLIVNAAAYTDVDKAEEEPFVTEAINSEAAALLAREADRRCIPMIHFSTDYVFDGQQWTRPYREEDRPNPLTYYGWTKHEGEIRIRNILKQHLIFRLSGLYGTRKRNFFVGMMRQLRAGKTPRVVNDQIVSPNWTPLVAEILSEVIRNMSRNRSTGWGTYHLTGAGNTTWYEFARAIFEQEMKMTGIKIELPIPVTTEEFGAPARRPTYSVLHPEKFEQHFDLKLPDWKTQFLHCVNSFRYTTPQADYASSQIESRSALAHRFG